MPLAVFPKNGATTTVGRTEAVGPFDKEKPSAFTGYSNLQKRQVDDLYLQLNGVCGVFTDKHNNLYKDVMGDGVSVGDAGGVCGRLVKVENEWEKWKNDSQSITGSRNWMLNELRTGTSGVLTYFNNWKNGTAENQFEGFRTAVTTGIEGSCGRILSLEERMLAGETGIREASSVGICGAYKELYDLTLGLSGDLNKRIDGNCGSIHGLCGWVYSFSTIYEHDVASMSTGMCGAIKNLYNFTVGACAYLNNRIDGLCGIVHGLCGWVKEMQNNIGTIADDYINNRIADYTYDYIKDQLTHDGTTGSTLALALAERMAAVYQRDLDEVQWNAIRAVLPEAKEYTDAELADLHVAVGGEILGAKSQLEGRILAMEEYIRTMLTTYQISTDGSSLYAYTGKTQDVAIPNEIEVAEGVTADNTANQVFWAASRYALGANDWNLVLQFSDYGYNNLYNKVRVEVPAFTGVGGAVAPYKIEFDKQDISSYSHFHHVTLANCQGVSGANATYLIQNDLVVKYLALDGSVVHQIVLSKAAFEALSNSSTVYPLAITSGTTGTITSQVGFTFTNSGASSETVKVYSNRLGLVSVADVTAAAGATASINVLGTNLEAGDVLYLVSSANQSQKSGYFRMPALPSFSYSGPLILTNGVAMTSALPDNEVAPTSFSISPTQPTGLTFSKETGELSGTPTAEMNDTIYTITGHNISGDSKSTLTIRVNAPSYSYEITAVGKTDNKWTLTYNIGTVVEGAKFWSTTFAYPIATPASTTGTGKTEVLALEEYLAEGGQVYVAVKRTDPKLSAPKRVDDPEVAGTPPA